MKRRHPLLYTCSKFLVLYDLTYIIEIWVLEATVRKLLLGSKVKFELSYKVIYNSCFIKKKKKIKGHKNIDRDLGPQSYCSEAFVEQYSKVCTSYLEN